MGNQSIAFLGGNIMPILHTTPFNMITKIVYVKPRLDDLAAGLSSAKYEYAVGDPVADVGTIYRYFSQPWNGTLAQLRHVSSWTHRTGFDIDLKEILPGIGQWVAIAVNFDASSNGNTDFSFLAKDGDQWCDPSFAAVTVGTLAAQKNLSWIKEDTFSDGLGLDTDTLGVTVRRTVVFTCQLKSSSTHGSVPFNLGVTLNSNPVTEWSLPLILDPEIKNDG